MALFQVNRMRSARWLSALLGAGLLGMFALTSQSTQAQFTVPKESRLEAKEPTSEARIKLGDMQRGALRVKGPDQKSNLAILKQNALFYVNRITHSEYYDPLSSGDLKARPENKSVEALIRELNSTLLFPVPETSAKFSPDQQDFIFEYGAAIDTAIRDVLTTRGTIVLVRVNATRMLAAAAKSGAPAFSKTIVELLTHQFFKIGGKPTNTPPEVYYHALKAAENILSSYHPVWHLDPARLTRHALKDDELVPLVKVLEDIVLNGPTIMAAAYMVETPPMPMGTPPVPMTGTTPPMNPPAAPMAPAVPASAPAVSGRLDPKTMTPEQLQVFEFYRRQAVRALARVRFDVVGSAPNELRPGFTLAKIAVSDVSVVPAPSPHEISEAVYGLVNLTPSDLLRVDEWALAVARGVELMLAPKLEAEDNQTLPWKVFSAKMIVSLNGLKQSLATARNKAFFPYRMQIAKLCDILVGTIFSKMDKDDPSGVAKPSRDELAAWMEQNPSKEPRVLYEKQARDTVEYKLNPRQGR